MGDTTSLNKDIRLTVSRLGMVSIRRQTTVNMAMVSTRRQITVKV
jgi:hypothetical protein